MASATGLTPSAAAEPSPGPSIGNEHYTPTLRLAMRHSTNAGTLGGPKNQHGPMSGFRRGILFKTKAVHYEVHERCHVKPIQAYG